SLEQTHLPITCAIITISLAARTPSHFDGNTVDNCAIRNVKARIFTPQLLSCIVVTVRIHRGICTTRAIEATAWNTPSSATTCIDAGIDITRTVRCSINTAQHPRRQHQTYCTYALTDEISNHSLTSTTRCT